jgi:hypothetical protein
MKILLSLALIALATIALFMPPFMVFVVWLLKKEPDVVFAQRRRRAPSLNRPPPKISVYFVSERPVVSEYTAEDAVHPAVSELVAVNSIFRTSRFGEDRAILDLDSSRLQTLAINQVQWIPENKTIRPHAA